MNFVIAKKTFQILVAGENIISFDVSENSNPQMFETSTPNQVKILGGGTFSVKCQFVKLATPLPDFAFYNLAIRVNGTTAYFRGFTIDEDSTIRTFQVSQVLQLAPNDIVTILLVTDGSPNPPSISETQLTILQNN